MKRYHGFVLIDLLLTGLIISVLATVLLPVFARAREKARTSVCQSNLQQIGMALQVYAADHYGRYPPLDNDFRPLLPYLQEEGVLRCPSRPEPTPSYTFHGGFANDDSPMRVLAHDREDQTVHSEGLNVLFLDGHVKWLTRRHFDTTLRGQLEEGRNSSQAPETYPPGTLSGATQSKPQEERTSPAQSPPTVSTKSGKGK